MRNQDDGERFDFGIRTLEEVELLAADLVPRTMKADARRMLEFMDLPSSRRGRFGRDDGHVAIHGV